MRTIEEVKEYFLESLSKGEKHKHYTRTVELAEYYYSLVTGDGLDDKLQQITTRETNVMFEQRKRITKHIIPCIINPIKMPFYKVARTQPISRVIDWENADNTDDRKQELEERLDNYWGRKSIEEFMEWAYVDYNFIDPNAFIMTDFEDFDPKQEKAKPYPIIIPSSQAVDYEYKNDVLKWLAIERAIKYEDQSGAMLDGKQYIILTGETTYQFTQVANNYQSEQGELIRTDRYTFELLVFEPKAQQVPAHRVGYVRDYITDGETFVSPYHSGLPILEKTLKINSELDLSTAMVAFPQRFAYSQPCSNEACHKGQLSDGTTCPVCQGTGVAQRHGSTADVIELPMPQDKDEMFDLTKMLHYVMPPIELLKFQDSYIEKLSKKVYAVVFNSEIFTRSEIASTATEKILEVENLNDTLYPFGRKYSQLWEAIALDVATFIDLGDKILLQHLYPKDFKFKSLAVLMTDLKMAKDSGASSSTIAAIEDDINEILYADRPTELNKIRIKSLFNPFRGFDAQRVALVIGTGRTTRYNEILYLNIEAIFQKLEENTSVWVYDLPMNVINGLVRVEVEELIRQIDEEKPAPVQPFTNFNSDGEPEI